MREFDLLKYKAMVKKHQKDAVPLPLDKDEIDCFKDYRLSEESFLAYDDTQTPSVPHFFAVYQK